MMYFMAIDSRFDGLKRFVGAGVAAMLCLSVATPSHAAWQPVGAGAAEMTLAQAQTTQGIMAPARDAYFSITTDDVSRAVAEQLALQAVEQKADVSVAAGIPKIIHSADHPLKLVVHALQIDTQSRRWQAQANILAAGKTVTVKPVSGTYMGMMDVPTVTRQLGRNDVIEASDITMKAFPQAQLRKETITDASKLIGLSPRNMISANRPIRQSEVNSPVVVKKGDAVQMTYTNAYMSIKTTGVALQDGAKGDMIRVKNDKSEKAISGRIQNAGHIEVNDSAAL
jgi:flagellar basal body P-ring formation protein FlgA